jgi:hypothetical protein
MKLALQAFVVSHLRDKIRREGGARKVCFVLVVGTLLNWPLHSALLRGQSDGKDSGERFLLVRDADKRNYYDLCRWAKLFEPQLHEELFRHYRPSPKSAGSFDILTDHSGRYGAYHAWKVRLKATTDSSASPRSNRDSIYVLSYSRNPDWIICATRYSLEPLKDGARRLVYIDFQSRKETVMDLSADWPRAWRVEEVEMVNEDAMPEIWAASKR